MFTISKMIVVLTIVSNDCNADCVIDRMHKHVLWIGSSLP